MVLRWNAGAVHTISCKSLFSFVINKMSCLSKLSQCHSGAIFELLACLLMRQESIINLDPDVGVDGSLDLGVGQQRWEIIFKFNHDWGITFEC